MSLFYLQDPNAVLLKGFRTSCEPLLLFLRGSVGGMKPFLKGCERQLIARSFSCYSTFRSNSQLKMTALNLLCVIALLYRNCKTCCLSLHLNRPCSVVAGCKFSICCKFASTHFFFFLCILSFLCSSVWMRPLISCNAS